MVALGFYLGSKIHNWWTKRNQGHKGAQQNQQQTEEPIILNLELILFWLVLVGLLELKSPFKNNLSGLKVPGL